MSVRLDGLLRHDDGLLGGRSLLRLNHLRLHHLRLHHLRLHHLGLSHRWLSHACRSWGVCVSIVHLGGSRVVDDCDAVGILVSGAVGLVLECLDDSAKQSAHSARKFRYSIQTALTCTRGRREGRRESDQASKSSGGAGNGR
jgi:hypothetical protein